MRTSQERLDNWTSCTRRSSSCCKPGASVCAAVDGYGLGTAPGLLCAVSESQIIRVDLLSLLFLHKRSGKVVLERSEVGKSCLRHYVTKTRVTSFVRDAHISNLSSTRANKASSRQAGGERVTPCLPSRLSRVRVPSPALLYEPSLCWLTTGRFTASGDGVSKQAIFYARKGVQRHPALARTRTAY